MRAKEFIFEVDTTPIQPVAGIDADIQGAEQPATKQSARQMAQNNMPIVLGLRQAAANQPTNPTGNTGIDNLLFNVANLSKTPGKVTNTLAKGINAVGGALAQHTSRQRTQFGYQPRKGSDILRGIPTAGAEKVSPGVAKMSGVQSIPKDIADFDQMAKAIKAAITPDQPVNPTKNKGIDSILQRAGIKFNTSVGPLSTQGSTGNIDQDIAGA